jgi:hypothetical protein
VAVTGRGSFWGRVQEWESGGSLGFCRVKVRFQNPAPEGAIDKTALAVRLKAYPDTNRDFSLELRRSARIRIALARPAENKGAPECALAGAVLF